ncbi:hypothetical protein QQ020_34485 [Fulvivirgaceae bacterium BMA12]|uniref:Uncharacterized protein n=1 Tax=Agaribacillus aureus TaxID=3051825 RepID=A0ABT8LJY2_9BACT|nr:hypothetical protein [Fulvivirgaceae bacterium BMA12]
MNWITRELFFIPLLLILTTVAGQAQKKIRLTNQETGKEFFLTEGMRISYLLKDKSKSRIGILDKIDSDTITVNNELVAIVTLKSIGQKKKGSGFGSFILGGFGSAIFFSAFTREEDPCPNCQTVSVEGEGLSAMGKALAVVGGATMMVLSAKSAVKNSLRDIQTKWELDIVE